jgi:hypothetical protein
MPGWVRRAEALARVSQGGAEAILPRASLARAVARL